MNELAQLGKKRTVSIATSILLVSLHTIYLYHASKDEINTVKLMQQLIRLSLTIGLLVMLYKGKKWARNIALVLFSIAILGAGIGIFTIQTDLILKSPLIVMLFVYSYAVYHFGFSKSYKAFSRYLRDNEHNEYTQ